MPPRLGRFASSAFARASFGQRTSGPAELGALRGLRRPFEADRVENVAALPVKVWSGLRLTYDAKDTLVHGAGDKHGLRYFLNSSTEQVFVISTEKATGVSPTWE